MAESNPKRIVVIGGGAVGASASYMLAQQGYDVVVIDSGDLSDGASAAVNINHSDGFEYHKRGHQKTGEYCIDGAITKSLFYQTIATQGEYENSGNPHDTGVCTVRNPIRFMVSRDSLGKDELTEESFCDNAEHMREHFRKRFTHLAEQTEGGAALVEKILGRNPENFARKLQPEEYADCAHIACGYTGSGTGVRPFKGPLLDLLKNSGGQKVYTRTSFESLEKQEDGSYMVITLEGKKFPADHIIIAAGHHVPEICSKIKNAAFRRKDRVTSADGTYYLNAMTYVTLPPTADQELIKKLTHVNFTLQGEGGAMFACIRPPGKYQVGRGAIYYPSEKGSQLIKHVYDNDHPELPPAVWDRYIQHGLSKVDPRVEAIMEQAYRYYPFLKDYAEVDRVICRTVFNAANHDNEHGLDRRVRDIIDSDIITEDGHVVAYRAPKWTNAELVALMAVDQARQALGDKPLPKSQEHGYGPTHIDVEKLFPIIPREQLIQHTRIPGSSYLNSHWER